MHIYLVDNNWNIRYATKDLEYAIENCTKYLLRGKENDPYYFVERTDVEDGVELSLYSRPRFLWVSYDRLEDVVRIEKIPVYCRKGDSSSDEEEEEVEVGGVEQEVEPENDGDEDTPDITQEVNQENNPEVNQENNPETKEEVEQENNQE